MKSFFVISLIVLIAAMVSAQETLTGLYNTRRLPAQNDYAARSLHAANQEYGQAQQARAVAAQAAHAAHANQMAPSAGMNARQVDMMVRQAADKAAIMVTRWAKALRETMIENAGREASAEGQAF